MAKRKKLTKTQRDKINIRNLRKACKANRKNKRSRKSRSKSRLRRSKKSRAKRSSRRRNPSSRRKKATKKGIRRHNSGLLDSLPGMDLNYAYTTPKRWNRRWNPEDILEPTPATPATLACDCGSCPEHGHLVTGTSARFRRNPGWSFRKGRAVPHEQEFSSMYHRSVRKPGLRRFNPGSGVFRASMCDSPW